MPTYWNTSFSKICLGMKIGEQIDFIVINKQANSLYSLVADGQYRATSLGRVRRDMWKKLTGSEASLQCNCNNEGFNVVSLYTSFSKARIGILGNEQISAKPVIPELDLVQEDTLMTPTRVEIRVYPILIMEINTSKPWDTSWCSDRKRRLIIIPSLYSS